MQALTLHPQHTQPSQQGALQPCDTIVTCRPVLRGLVALSACAAACSIPARVAFVGAVDRSAPHPFHTATATASARSERPATAALCRAGTRWSSAWRRRASCVAASWSWGCTSARILYRHSTAPERKEGWVGGRGLKGSVHGWEGMPCMLHNPVESVNDVAVETHVQVATCCGLKASI